MNETMAAIERRRQAMNLTREDLCRASGVSRRTYGYAVNGEVEPYPSTLAKLNKGLTRYRIGFAEEAGEIAPHAAFTGCVLLAAFWLKTDQRAALNADPGRRATADPAWQQAAKARQLGYWIANQFFGFAQSDIGRAAGVSKQAVQNAIKAIEIERDEDPELNRICSEIERVFE